MDVSPALRRVGARLARLLAGLCDRCQACGGLLPDTAGPHPLCPSCAIDLAPRLGGFCPVCGDPRGDANEPAALCPTCRVHVRPWTGFAFHGRYTGLLRDMVLGFKFHGRLGQGRLLAGLVAEAWLRAASRGGTGAPDPAGPDCIVPIPLHPKRLAWRGFNQSLELARLLSQRLDRPLCPAALTRIRDTTPQSQLDGVLRRDNIKGAFRADARRVAGRRVLLLDDVMTTGATVETAARALLQAGATRVEVVVVAR